MQDTMILGSVSVKDFLYNELAELVLPSSVLLQANMDETEMPSDPRFQIAKHMDGFVKRFGFVRTLTPSFYSFANDCSHSWTRIEVPVSTDVVFAAQCVILWLTGIIYN